MGVEQNGHFIRYFSDAFGRSKLPIAFAGNRDPGEDFNQLPCVNRRGADENGIFDQLLDTTGLGLLGIVEEELEKGRVLIIVAESIESACGGNTRELHYRKGPP